MSKLLNEEVSESTKPLILIGTNNKDLQNLFYEEFSDKLSVLFLSNSAPENEGSQVYHIKPSDSNLLPQLEEKLDYSIIVFETEEDKKRTSDIVEKINADGTKTVFLFPAENYESFLDVMLSVKQFQNIIPALYGTILEYQSSNSQFLKIIRMGLGNERITLSGNDLMPVFPISKKDFSICVRHLLFSHKRHAVYYMFYRNPQTLLSAVHYLARVEPELVFEVDHESKIESFEERTVMDQKISEKLNLRIHYLDNYLKGFAYAIENLKIKKPKAYEAAANDKTKKIRFSKIQFPGFTPSIPLAMFSALLAFILINAVFLAVGVIFLRGSIQAFENSNFKDAKEKGVLAKNILSIPMPTLHIAESILSYIPILQTSYKTLNLVTSTSDMAVTSAELITKLDKIDQGIVKSDFEKIISDSYYLYHAGTRTLLNTENRAISNLLKPEVSKSLSLITVLPNIMGYFGEKEYLLLFMNNAELRPNGGFIGSVGRLIVENGRVKDFLIQDVYDLDGQLTHHIEPHYIIRRNLQPHLYLRDSNFELDFERSASMSARIYQLESGNSPDGVAAIDFTFIKEVLEIVGPVRLASYNQTLDAQNSLQFLQQTIEDNKFEGSAQKKAVLNDLFTAIMLRIENNPEYLVSIGLKLPELLEKKHILLSYQTPDIQSLFTALNFSGKIPLRIDSGSEIIYDTLGFNEANIGVNKVNSFISRSIFYEADLNTRISRSKLSLRNESSNESYKAYVRLITPRNSIFRTLSINGEVQETIEAVTDPRIYEAANFSPENGVYEIETSQDYYKTIFGTVIEVEKNSVLTLEIEYTNPTLFLDKDKDSYDLFAIKQPGTYTTPVSFNIKYPQNFTAAGEGITSFGQGVVKFEGSMDSDLNYRVNFSEGD